MTPSSLHTRFIHLFRVATHCHENKMSAANLSVVFGPTLMQAPGTAGGMMNLSHQNTVGQCLRFYTGQKQHTIALTLK